MNKYLLIGLMFAVLMSAASISGSAYAQGINPDCTGDCTDHDAMLALFSEKLGISVDELQSRLENGESMAQIALAAGMTFEEFRALMPKSELGQRAAGLFGRGSRRGAQGTQTPFGSRACLENPDCTPSYWGQQGSGRGTGRAN